MVNWTNSDLADYVSRRRRKQQVGDALSGAGASAQLERSTGYGALATPQAEKRDSANFLVRVTSYRRRLLDEDNLCEKFHVDCLRYAGIIPGDAPGQTRIEVRQEKVRKGEAEEIVIEVYEQDSFGPYGPEGDAKWSGPYE